MKGGAFCRHVLCYGYKLIYKGGKMGYNLISCCHKCKEQIFYFRGKENDAILPFYRKHANCAKECIDNVQTVMDNNSTDQEWQDGEDNGGYKTSDLQT